MRRIPTCSESIFRRGLAVWLLIFAFASAVRADDSTLEVIPLQHRLASEILPLLQPFVAKDGVIKAADDKLIVRTSPANLAELRKLVIQLDQPLRRLLITVKQVSGDTARDSGAAVSGSIGEHSHAEAKVWQTEKRDNADRVQQVQVMEGGQAFIDVGRQIPISDFIVEQSRGGMRIEQQTRYAGATTGFYATPRLNGDTVTIDISPYQTTAEGVAKPPSFNVQSLHTTVTGKLGKWIQLGARSTRVEDEDSGVITYSTSQRGEQDRRILLRVTVAP